MHILYGNFELQFCNITKVDIRRSNRSETGEISHIIEGGFVYTYQTMTPRQRFQRIMRHMGQSSYLMTHALLYESPLLG